MRKVLAMALSRDPKVDSATFPFVDDILVNEDVATAAEVKQHLEQGCGVGVGVGVGVGRSRQFWPESESESESMKFCRLRLRLALQVKVLAAYLQSRIAFCYERQRQ